MKLSRKSIIIILAIFFLSGLFLFFRPINEENNTIYYKNIKDNDFKVDQENTKETIPPEFDNKKSGEGGKNINMLFFGDLMLDRHVKERMGNEGVEYVFKNFNKKIFNNKDLISANLEGAVTDEGKHYDPAFAYDFAFTPSIIESLKKYNFNFFNLANNHLSDQGERGIIETRKNLDNLKINYSGCRDKEIGECSAAIIVLGGKNIGMAGFSMVYGKFDMAAATSTINNIKESVDLVIINIHWGEEYKHNFNILQQTVAHNLIDAGADIIIGHHPHVVQGMEIYKNKSIFYSLGNFIFDQYFSPDTQEELAIGAAWEENKIKFIFYPMKSKMSQLELIEGEEKDEFLKKFISWSKNIDYYEKNIKNGEFIINFK